MHVLKIALATGLLASLAACETKVIAPPAQTTVIREREPVREVVRERVPEKPSVQNNISVEK